MIDDAAEHPPVDNSVNYAVAFGMTDVFGMTDLEERLRGVEGEQIAKELLARFHSIDAELSARIASGLSPEDFARATVTRNSLAAANNILIRIPKGKP